MFEKNELPILGILRGISKQDIEPIAGLCMKCGLEYLEITMNTDQAGELITDLINFSDNKIKVGAGTVLNTKDMEVALKAGAKFIVCPSIIEDVVKECVAMKIPVFPGALTPTEVHKAWDMGATMVKLFPASLFDPSYIKEIKAPFNKVRIMAVGGVSEKNIEKYFKSGAEAVAFGASILNLHLIREGKLDLVEEKLKSLIGGYNNWIEGKGL